MMRLASILVPVDFSKRSVLAAEHGAALARRFDSRLTFVHVVPPSPYEYAAFDEGFYAAASWPTLDEVRVELTKRLEELEKEASIDRPAEKVLRRGDPALEIEAAAREAGADMIVMPTHGAGPFRRFVLGSVTSKILHDTKLPVFTGTHVPELAPVNREPYKRIACAVDLHEHSEQTLRWAWEFAQAFEEDLIVIHAAPQILLGPAYSEWFPPESQQEAIAKARDRVERMLSAIGARAEIHVEAAEPIEYIAKTADEAYADILIVGRSIEGGVLGIREHAFSLIREAPCPVISV